jgi:hypothetical protein
MLGLVLNPRSCFLPDEILGLNGRTAELSRNTPLLGTDPLDAIKVVSPIARIEETGQSHS